MNNKIMLILAIMKVIQKISKKNKLKMNLIIIQILENVYRIVCIYKLYINIFIKLNNLIHIIYEIFSIILITIYLLH